MHFDSEGSVERYFGALKWLLCGGELTTQIIYQHSIPSFEASSLIRSFLKTGSTPCLRCAR